jgi:uncharacterized protein YjeT (DUF2065 family)
MSDLLTAVALIFVIEGVLYALFPDFMRKILAEALKLPVSSMRMGGLIAVVIGAGLIWLIKG